MTCTKCRLHETCRTVKVQPRVAEHQAGEIPVMFVGEAPGAEEDQRGLAFVGPAGQLLDQAIQEFNLKPYFITNTVRCQPPGNRKPRVDEVAACLPYLKEEIKAVRPKFIITLGNIPLEALTGKSGVTTFSGTVVKEIAGIKVFSLFHPAYILHSPEMLPKFEMHLRELKRVMSGEKREENIKVLDVTPQQAGQILLDMEGRTVAFDYETTGLAKGTDGRVRSVGFSDGAVNFVVNCEAYAESFKLMKWFLASDRWIKAAHNAPFETKWSVDEYGVEPVGLKLDTYLLQYLLDENASRDLEVMAAFHLKADTWNIEAEMAEKGWTHATIPYENLVLYNGKDAHYTARLAKHIAGLLDPELKQHYKNVLLPLSQLCSHLERTGIKIDRQWASKADKKYAVRQALSYKSILSIPEIQAYIKRKCLVNKKFEFNPGSSPQIRDVVFHSLGFISNKKTKKGNLLSTDKKVIEKFKGQHPFIDNYLKWKSDTTIRDNFLVKFPEFADAEGIVRPHWNAAGTVTGRPTAVEPPMQTLPRPDDDGSALVRGMLISRFLGGKLISNDYAQLEVRILMNEAEEWDVVEAINKGLDLHNFTAERIFGKNFSKKQRDVAKTINFATGYGIQDETLAFKFNMQVEEAGAIINRFWKSYRKAYLWFERQHEFVRKNGWIRSRFGTIRHLPEAPILAARLLEGDKAAKWKLAALLRQAGNYPIQNQGALINDLACVKIHARINAKGSAALICLPIHDSAMVDTPKAEIKAISALCREVMEDEMQRACHWLKVKLKVDQSISERWAN